MSKGEQIFFWAVGGCVIALFVLLVIAMAKAVL